MRSTGRLQLPRDVLVVAGLIALGVGLPALFGAASGGLDVPHNDDFNYRRIALEFYETGQIRLTGWSVMTLVGQIVVVQPFLWLSGGDDWAYWVCTALFTVIGIGAAYYLLRRLLPRWLAAFGGLGLVVFPGFMVNTTSFMTDVPAFAASTLCLALGAMAGDRRGTSRWIWLTVALAIGCFGFSIREFGLAAPVAVLISAGAGAETRRGYFIAGFATLATCAVIYALAKSLPGQATLMLDFERANFERVRFSAATLALALSPVLVLTVAAGWRRWRLFDLGAGAAAALVLHGEVLLTIAKRLTLPQLLVGNALGARGAPGGVFAGSRPILLGSPTWDVIKVVGLVSVIVGIAVLGGAIGRWMRSPAPHRWSRLVPWLGSTPGLLATFALLYGGGLAVFGLVAPLFDRYLWLMYVPLAGLLLRSTVPKGAALVASRMARMGPALVAAALTAGLASVSFVLVLNAFAFDVAGWRMGEQAVEMGFDPQRVDAGMTWVGYHASGVATWGAEPAGLETWYDAMWPSFDLCAVVSSSPLEFPDYRLVAEDLAAYRLILFAGPIEPLFLYEVDAPGCR